MFSEIYAPLMTTVKAALGAVQRPDVLPGHTTAQLEPHAIPAYCGGDQSERLISMREVSQHCDPQSCWVVVNNVVYDLTDFIYEHPGGMDIMLEHAGTDCTGAFEDVGHSAWAARSLQKYKIGVLRPEERIIL